MALLRPHGGGVVTSVTGVNPVTSTGGAAPAIGLRDPNYQWQFNNAPIAVTTTPATMTAATVNPTTTGRFSVRVTGVADNADSANTHTLQLELTNTFNAGTFTPPPIEIGPSIAGAPGKAAFAFSVALDQLAVNPAVLPLATPNNLTIVGSADVNGQVTIPTNGLTVEFVERLTN